MGIRDNRYDALVPTVAVPISQKFLVHGDDGKFCREHTNKKLKFTLPGPMTICDTIADTNYGNRSEMAMAFAELLNQEAKVMQTIGVNVIKFDEPAFNLFLSDVFEWGIETLNRTIDGVICTKAAHICYGYGIQENLDWKETLGIEWHRYKKISPTLNASRIQQVSLECANLNVPILLIGLLLRQDNPGRSD